MENKELTNGGSISLRIGEVITNEQKEIQMPPEKSKKLTIVTMAKLKELEENGCLEISVDNHEVIRDSEGKVKRRIDSETGKELTSGKEEELEK